MIGFFLIAVAPIFMLLVLLACLALGWKLVVVDKKPPRDWPGLATHLRDGLKLSFETKSGHKGFADIFWWWELRRWAYNVRVGTTGLIASLILWAVALAFTDIPPEPFKILLAYLGLSLFYGVGANLCYCAGWLVQAITFPYGMGKSAGFGPVVYKAGLYFSMVLTAAIPFTIAAIVLLYNKP